MSQSINENNLLLLSGFENTQNKNPNSGMSHVRKARTKSLFQIKKFSNAEKSAGFKYSSNDILRLNTK